ncbi:hypothetical protein NLT72_002848 [Citrobacter farmeri]
MSVTRYDVNGPSSVFEDVNGSLVDYKDYAALEAKCAALAAENAGLKKIVDFVTDLDNEPQYHDEGMGCGLEDRGINDRYEAMRHGWDEAMERIYGEVIPCAEEIAFPATAAFLAEVRAQARTDFIGRIEWIIRNECNPEKTETILNELQSFSETVSQEAAQ